MHKVLMAAAVAAFVATPALAQQGPWLSQSQYSPEVPTYMYAPGPYAQVEVGPDAQAYAGIMAPPAVSVEGFILGRDPDPNVRAELQRNQDFYLGRAN